LRAKLLIIAVYLLTATVYADFTGIVVKVYDADTITVNSATILYKVRLYGIDAPEKAQAYGVEATAALSERILGRSVTIIERGTDQYRRIIGVVMLGAVDINLELLQKGLVWCYRQYNRNPAYIVAEDAARGKKIGLWGTTAPQAPWEYRKAMKNVRK
jgi:endonuclease YncB( thermonuclease family)